MPLVQRNAHHRGLARLVQHVPLGQAQVVAVALQLIEQAPSGDGGRAHELACHGDDGEQCQTLQHGIAAHQACGHAQARQGEQQQRESGPDHPVGQAVERPGPQQHSQQHQPDGVVRSLRVARGRHQQRDPRHQGEEGTEQPMPGSIAEVVPLDPFDALQQHLQGVRQTRFVTPAQGQRAALPRDQGIEHAPLLLAYGIPVHLPPRQHQAAGVALQAEPAANGQVGEHDAQRPHALAVMLQATAPHVPGHQRTDAPWQLEQRDHQALGRPAPLRPPDQCVEQQQPAESGHQQNAPQVVGEQHQQLVPPAGASDQPRLPGQGDGKTFTRIQLARGRQAQAVALLLEHLVGPFTRTPVAGVAMCRLDLRALRQQYLDAGVADRQRPVVAGHVPVEFIDAGVMQQLRIHPVGQFVDMRPRLEPHIGAAQTQTQGMLEALLGDAFRTPVTRGRYQRQRRAAQQAVAQAIADGNVAVDTTDDHLAFGHHRDALGHQHVATRLDLHAHVIGLNRLLGTQAERAETAQPQQHTQSS